MTRFATLCAALLLAGPAAAQDQVQPADPRAADEPMPSLIDSRAAPEDFEIARKKVVECEGEKFVFAWGAGARPTKVTLCSKEGATPDEVVAMLDDAATKLEQTEAMAEDRRIAIVQQIRAKISALQGESAAAADPAAAPPADVAQVPVAPRPPGVQPTVAPRASNTAAAATRPVLATKPDLAIECYAPGAAGRGGPCVMLERDTRLTVTARERLAGGTSLRFLRKGKHRAETALPQLRKGQAVQLTLPRAVCAGVLNTVADIQIVRGGQVVESIGPYRLRC
jgi:hypothetical protein